MKIVVIEWIDATFSEDDHGRLDRLEPSRLISVGFLVDTHAGYVTIAQEFENETEISRRVTTIPRINITTLRELESESGK